MTEIEPLEIAVKFNPPKIAVVYRRNKSSYVREFPIAPEDLEESTTALLEALVNSYPGYFGMIDAGQISKLIDKMKGMQSRSNQMRFGKIEGFKPKMKDGPADLKNYNKFIDEMDLYSPRRDEEEEEGSFEEGSYEDRRYNYDELDREMEGSSEEDIL